MDKRGAGLLDVRERGHHRVLEEGAGHLRLGSVVLGRLDLGHRRSVRQEDARTHAELAGRPSNCLPVIAGAGRYNPGRALLGRQRAELVDSAADLERAGPLEVLGFEAHLTPTAAREGLRQIDRRLFRDSLETLPRLLDVSERWFDLLCRQA